MEQLVPHYLTTLLLPHQTSINSNQKQRVEIRSIVNIHYGGKKKGVKEDSKRGRNHDVTTSPQASKTAVVDSDDDELPAEGDVHPIFTHNNKPYFPTSCTTSWLPTFKIELGEERYKIDEVKGNDVLCVSTYTKSLNDFWTTLTPGDVVANYGDISCVTNLTRELCKGILKAFEKLMNSSAKDEPMWLDNYDNYRLCGVEEYQNSSQHPLVQGLDNFSSPIKVIITKENQNQPAQRTEDSKFRSIRCVLEQLYPPQVRNQEWTDMIGYLCTDKYKKDCCEGLPISKHWLFWHCSRRMQFIKDIQYELVKEAKPISQAISCAFDNMSFLDSNWENVFQADPPLQKVWKHVRMGGSGTATQGGKQVASSSNIGGGGALSKLRREKGKLLIMKIRNCAEHVCEHRPTYDANGMYLGKEYPNIDETCQTDVYYKMRNYLALRLLQKFPDLWNDLVPAVRKVGYMKY